MRRVLIGVIASTMLLAVGQAKGDSIAFLNEATYLLEPQRTNLYASLGTVTDDVIGVFGSPPDSTESASWQSALGGAKILVIPSLEVKLGLVLKDTTKDLVRSFVNNGGGLIAVGSNVIEEWNPSYIQVQPTTQFLNEVFGFKLIFSRHASPTNPDGTLATTTLATSIAPFGDDGDDPSELPNSPLTSLVTKTSLTSLPAGSLSIYEKMGETSVFGAEYGSGRIAFLGFGWNTDDSLETADWNKVLGSAVEYVRPEEVNVVPEPTTLALWQLGAAGVVLAIRRRRRK